MPSYRGELGLPNKHAIAATHQGADSNAALPRRGSGDANAEAWRGDDGSRLLACSSPPPAWFRWRRHRRRRQRGLCCGSAAAPRARAARVARPAAGPASCVGGRGVDVVLGSASAQRQREPSFKAVLCVARQACAGLPELVRSRRSAVARRTNQRVARRACTRIKPFWRRFLRGIHTSTFLGYLKGTSWRYRAAHHRGVQPTVPQ